MVKTFLLDNWISVLVIALTVFNTGLFVGDWLKMPKRKQLEMVREWLVWAVAQAEREMGGKTGVLKLRQVYDKFLERFPEIAKAIDFTFFSSLVDEALAKMRKIAEDDPVKMYLGR